MSGPVYTLRDAHESDLGFIYGIFAAIRSPDKIYDDAQEFRKFKNSFVPNEIGIIQHQGKDVGRLRVQYNARFIYVGGIQLMPDFQGLGIGSAIFADLIRESEWSCHPILLEVHSENLGAQKLYEKLGFVRMGLEEREDTGCFFRLARLPFRR